MQLTPHADQLFAHNVPVVVVVVVSVEAVAS
jgi:hypothetical protein